MHQLKNRQKCATLFYALEALSKKDFPSPIFQKDIITIAKKYNVRFSSAIKIWEMDSFFLARGPNNYMKRNGEKKKETCSGESTLAPPKKVLLMYGIITEEGNIMKCTQLFQCV